MLLSLCLDPRRPWPDLLALAQAAEHAGLHTAYVVDHFMPVSAVGDPQPGPLLEGWTTLSALASATTQVRLGTLVLGNGYRHPAVVANMAATLDHVSGGRVTLGLGAGWQENEHAAYGLDFPAVRERLDRFEEAVQVISALLRNDVSTFTGEHYELAAARCEPRPVQQRLPLIVAGAGEKRTIPMAARYADAWHAWGSPEVFRHKSAVLDAACDAAGRDRAEVRRLTGQTVTVTSAVAVDEDDVIGPGDHVVEQLGNYRDVGVDEFVVRDYVETPIEVAIASAESLGAEVAPVLL